MLFDSRGRAMGEAGFDGLRWERETIAFRGEGLIIYSFQGADGSRFTGQVMRAS